MAGPDTRAIRLFLAARSRFAEDALTRAVGNGVRRIVVLGAGLATFAWTTSARPRWRPDTSSRGTPSPPGRRAGM